MCGIIGSNNHPEETIDHALKSFRYRGPDNTGIYSDEFVTLGHNRLSIIDLDKRSHQPMADIKKDVYVVFNGEIYNFRELRKILQQYYTFSTQSDTEVLLYAYKKWGNNFVQHLEGMYAVGIYDKPKKKLLLARDYAGIKPLYYYHNNKSFIFASEAKGILSCLPKEQRRVRQEVLPIYLLFGYIPSPDTLYENIYKLPPSSVLEYDLAKQRITSIQNYAPDTAHVKKESDFAKILEQKILDHLTSDVPVGLLFSGGTDSSLIAAVLKKNRIKLKTFSVQMSHKKEDAHFFKTIATFLEIQPTIYEFSHHEFDMVYEEVMTKIDEPSYDSSLFPTYFIAKKASQEVKVVLSGEGGDEFFYGYRRHPVLYKLRNAHDYQITWLDRLFFSLPYFSSKKRIFRMLFRWNKQPFSYYLTWMSPSGDLFNWSPAKELYRKRMLKPLEIDPVLSLENDLLRKIDFATSYNAIEGRVPLLDVQITQNASNFEQQHLAGGILKNFLKKILATYLPKDLVYRKKSGFGVQLRALFRKSNYLENDLKAALLYLETYTALPPQIRTTTPEKYIRAYPDLAFGLISLYRTVKNMERW